MDMEHEGSSESPPSPQTTALSTPLKVSLSFKNGEIKILERYLTARDTFETPDAERAELFRVFNRFDLDGDGYLSVAEFKASLEKLGIILSAADLEDLVSFSSDNHGISRSEDGPALPLQDVNFEAFYNLYRFLCAEESDDGFVCTPIGKICDAELKAAFDLFDKNHDNFISVTELQSVLLSFGFDEAKNENECRKMIASIDSDGDGVVSFSEFQAMMKNRK